MTDTEFEAHVERLKEDGYTVVPGMLTNDECDAATEELERLVKDKERGGMECVFNKARVFERIYQLPDHLRLMVFLRIKPGINMTRSSPCITIKP